MRFATDENFKGSILNQLLTRFPDMDVVRIQDTEMYQASDPEILAWAATEKRIILTHDVQTLVGDAYARVEQNLPMIGVILVPNTLPIGQALDELELVIRASQLEDFDNRVVFIPIN